jgi:tRNA 2-thiocytidine biosynthesis protein TtcA
MSFAVKEFTRLAGKALHTFDMIQDLDRVLVGLSGGKDSLALLMFLKDRLPRVPIDYHLVAVHLDMGYERPGDRDRLADFVESLGVEKHFEITEYAPLAHGESNKENPCFLCSRWRRKRLFELARDNNCSKVALGHHREDLSSTLLMNILYSGEISSMMPVQPFFNGLLTIIRPLCMVPEEKIARAVRQWDLPVMDSRCPSVGRTRRSGVRKILEDLSRANSKVKGNVFRSLSNWRSEYLLPRSGAQARPAIQASEPESSGREPVIMSENQRKRTRVQFKTTVNLTAPGIDLRGLDSRDLSLKGIFVETDHKVDVGADVDVTLELSGTSSLMTLEMKGRVARQDHDGLGLDFIEVDLDSFHHLRNIVLYNAGDPKEVDTELATTPAF